MSDNIHVVQSGHQYRSFLSQMSDPLQNDKDDDSSIHVDLDESLQSDRNERRTNSTTSNESEMTMAWEADSSSRCAAADSHSVTSSDSSTESVDLNVPTNSNTITRSNSVTSTLTLYPNSELGNSISDSFSAASLETLAAYSGTIVDAKYFSDVNSSSLYTNVDVGTSTDSVSVSSLNSSTLSNSVDWSNSNAKFLIEPTSSTFTPSDILYISSSNTSTSAESNVTCCYTKLLRTDKLVRLMSASKRRRLLETFEEFTFSFGSGSLLHLKDESGHRQPVFLEHFLLCANALIDNADSFSDEISGIYETITPTLRLSYRNQSRNNAEENSINDEDETGQESGSSGSLPSSAKRSLIDRFNLFKSIEQPPPLPQPMSEAVNVPKKEKEKDSFLAQLTLGSLASCCCSLILAHGKIAIVVKLVLLIVVVSTVCGVGGVALGYHIAYSDTNRHASAIMGSIHATTANTDSPTASSASPLPFDKTIAAETLRTSTTTESETTITAEMMTYTGKNLLVTNAEFTDTSKSTAAASIEPSTATFADPLATSPVTMSYNNPCPYGWRHSSAVSEKCFLVVAIRKVWFDAEVYCHHEHRNSFLTSIANSKEKDYINAIVYDMHRAIKDCDAFWIGLNAFKEKKPSVLKNETYSWTDGRPYNYSSWDDNQPDPEGVNDMCVISKARTTGKWSAETCGLEHCFICEHYTGYGQEAEKAIYFGK